MRPETSGAQVDPANRGRCAKHSRTTGPWGHAIPAMTGMIPNSTNHSGMLVLLRYHLGKWRNPLLERFVKWPPQPLKGRRSCRRMTTSNVPFEEAFNHQKTTRLKVVESEQLE